MKIHCDKFPKTPDDIAAVWDSELEGTEVSCNIKTIQTLQKQLDEISSEKVQCAVLENLIFAFVRSFSYHYAKMSFQIELSVLLLINYSAKHNISKCQTNNRYLEPWFLLLKARY